MKKIHPTALFRLSVLGQLASRESLSRGELKNIIRELSSKTYCIPGSQRVHLSDATIERWYYRWKSQGIDGLAPQVRQNLGQSKLPQPLQEAIITAKKEDPSRSINRIRCLLELNGLASKGSLPRSSVYRVLKNHGLSRRSVSDSVQIERRRFVAEHAGDLWQGDVMHGPRVSIQGKMRKLYLVSWMDDASRLMTHSEFRFGETALDIEAALKQAILKRGLPKRIILDNGSAYRSGSLQAICARLQIQLVFCRPYEPQGKGKIEKWHATFRDQFLNEIDWKNVSTLSDANERLWAWLAQVYHARPHGGLEKKKTPLERWQQDVAHIRPLGLYAPKLDELFYHRHSRCVRKDGSISLEGQLFEVPYELAKKTVDVVFDPHTQKAKWIESPEGERLGEVVKLDAIANNHRTRQRPENAQLSFPSMKTLGNTVDLAKQAYEATLAIEIPSKETKS